MTEPKATFSTCFGAPFLPLNPNVYAKMLGEKIAKHQAKVWLVNTGWTGGPYGVGSRMKIAHTRAMITAALSPFTSDPSIEMSTLCRRFEHEDEFTSPNVVKAVVSQDGFALYFSRAPVPYHRATANAGQPADAFKHIGLYVYRRTTLLRLASLPP